MLEKEKQLNEEATLLDKNPVKPQNKNLETLTNNQTIVETSIKDQTLTANQSNNKDVDFTEGALFANRYRIIKTLGEGAMGKVFEVEDTQNNKRVALKVIKKEGVDDETVKRFFREANLLNKLNHKNIVNVYGCGQYQEKPYFTMDIVEGITLKSFLAHKKAALKKRITMFIPVLEALHNAHENNVIHRDLKPANIMISNDNIPIVMDFGIARADDEESTKLTRTGMVLGTPMYMAPEQVNGEKVTPKTDIYALGVILYEIITLQPPFSGNLSTLMWKIGHQDPVHPCQINKNIPKDLANICLKAMAKNPNNRYKSAREMANDIKRYLSGKKIKVKTQNNQKLLKWCKQNRSILISSFILIIALIIVFRNSQSSGTSNANNLKVADNNTSNTLLVENTIKKDPQNILINNSKAENSNNKLNSDKLNSDQNQNHITPADVSKDKPLEHYNKYDEDSTHDEKYSDKYDEDNTHDEEYSDKYDEDSTHDEEYSDKYDEDSTHDEGKNESDDSFLTPIKGLPNPQDVKIVLDHVIEDECEKCTKQLEKNIKNIFSLKKEEIPFQVVTNTPHEIITKILEHAKKTSAKNKNNQNDTKKITVAEIRRRGKFLSDHLYNCNSCKKEVYEEKIVYKEGKRSRINWANASDKLVLLIWEHAHSPKEQKQNFFPFPPRKKK